MAHSAGKKCGGFVKNSPSDWKEVKRFLMLMLVTVILVCSCSLQAFAVDYNTDLYMMPYKLVEGFNIRFIPHEDFGQTSVDHMNHALYVWNQAMGKAF
ncbi:MAG: hypothetical protein ACLU5C_02285 [Acutalibacter sp.]